MNVNFNQFIVVGKDDWNRFDEKGKNDYTESGVILYPIGGLVPVIIKGKGCLANAKIHKITISDRGTTVTFTLTTIAKSTSEAIYDIYRNGVNAGTSSSSDKFEDSKDAVIPGVFTSKYKF